MTAHIDDVEIGWGTNGSDERTSPTDVIVSIPEPRRHRGNPTGSVLGLAAALILAVCGGVLVGAGYGAVISLNAEKLVNISLACSFPFWINIAAYFGFYLFRVPPGSARRRVEVLGFAASLYGVYVGWLACVLDGPGLVFDPLQLLSYVADPATHSFWCVEWQQELRSFGVYLLAPRAAEFVWLTGAGLMTIGAASAYPWCERCRCWMDDEVQVRVKYEPASTQQAATIAGEWVAEDYRSLVSIEGPIAKNAKSKGVELTVFSCPRCNADNVLNATWHRSTADPERDDVWTMIESASGTLLVDALKVTPAVKDHVQQLAERKAA